MAEFAKEQDLAARPEERDAARRRGLSLMAMESESRRKGEGRPGFEALDQEVVRDLRHAVGNHFHKLFYWADRLESEANGNGQRNQVEELTGALQRFQEYLELGLGYFEPQEGDRLEMGLGELADATTKVMRDHLGATDVALHLAGTDQPGSVRVDPQRLSLAIRMVADLLGGARRTSFDVRVVGEKDAGVCAIRIAADGGETPQEMPVLEWAIARKAVAAQGGVLARMSEADRTPEEGCVLRLPFGEW